MESINKLLYYIVGLIFFMGGIILTMQFIKMGETRENFVLEDQAKKSAVELNVAASEGSRIISSSEVLANIISHEDNLAVMVNGNNIPKEKRQAANAKYESLKNLVPDGNYEASYVFDANGFIIGVQYNRIS